jgi:hypothetical protein
VGQRDPEIHSDWRVKNVWLAGRRRKLLLIIGIMILFLQVEKLVSAWVPNCYVERVPSLSFDVVQNIVHGLY